MTDTLPNASRRKTLVMIGASLLWPCIGRAEATEHLSGRAFGTTWQVTGPTGGGLEDMRTEVEALFASVDQQMSPWRRDSAISRFNNAQAGWYPMQDELRYVAQSALKLADQSEGVFDPTIGPLVARWGFGPITEGAPGWSALAVDGAGMTKHEDGLTLDLCGIAKGWALDRAADLLRSRGHENLLFDLGGELVALGKHPSGRSWRVAVENPVMDAEASAVLRLDPGRAVATSGLRTQSYGFSGHQYGHIIDPLRGIPAESQVQSVTVLASDAMTADGWATALFAAGDIHGPVLARAKGIDAVFQIADGPALRLVTTGAIQSALS
jgi:thiamine biosynthesis lipoprotein